MVEEVWVEGRTHIPINAAAMMEVRTSVWSRWTRLRLWCAAFTAVLSVRFQISSIKRN